MTIREHSAEPDELLDELRAWLSDYWDPELTLGDWWERLGESGWCAPTLPIQAFGKGLSRSEANEVGREIAAHGAVGAPGTVDAAAVVSTVAVNKSDATSTTNTRVARPRLCPRRTR